MVEDIKSEKIFKGTVCEKSKTAHTFKEYLDILENMKKLNTLKGRASVNKGPCDLFFIIYAVLFLINFICLFLKTLLYVTNPTHGI